MSQDQYETGHRWLSARHTNTPAPKNTTMHFRVHIVSGGQTAIAI